MIGVRPSAAIAASLAREHEIRMVERSNRASLIARITPDYEDQSKLAGFQALTNKKLRSKSKEFRFMWDCIEPFNLSRMVTHRNGLSSHNINRLVASLNFMINSEPFISMDLEDATTDYFELCFAIYVALRKLHPILVIANIAPKHLNKFVYVSSEIGLRISSMYVDRRQ